MSFKKEEKYAYKLEDRTSDFKGHFYNCLNYVLV